ncbi:TolB family protein [Rhizobium giardinii]|uniref:Tol biopolymer transport system component n=1 Tax=Rhizobium giardinii TaxID=56731 RepID=A0A7W8UAB5_9HYPH|nr:TolB family protein [Rhizobium giardinii]MBB5534792.1 Tol biopolymer transport system component [Rhizobium giardinii]
MRSSVEIYTLETGESRVVWQTEQLVEAPNWSPDGQSLVINGDGLLYRLPLEGGEPALIDTGFARTCNNDHGISPDGKTIVISDKTEYGASTIYTLPATGGQPRQITQNRPSYWHGWSPDGKTLAYCGIRDQVFDIYTIPVTGGDETRLTFGEGRNDGPDYSHDGEWIYFNSSRTGRMQIWRVRPDGSDVTRITDSEFGDWFPHPSPDGKHLLVLSYDGDVFDHPRDLDVRMRLMDPGGGNARLLFELFGGQGTINVPNWSPDGKAFAFVRYQPA